MRLMSYMTITAVRASGRAQTGCFRVSYPRLAMVMYGLQW
jgi:hypothetical protein